MLGIAQGSSSNDPLKIAMKKNQAGIRATVTGENCPRLVKSVNEVSRNLAPLDKIGAGYRPFRFFPYGVDCCELLEGPDARAVASF
jgi:hypothetical protein